MTGARGMRRARGVLGFLGETLKRSAQHSVDTQSAALAFYTLFSLAPALLVVGTLTRRLLGEERIRGEIARQLQGLMGPDAGLAAASLLGKAAGSGAVPGPIGIVGIVASILGATAVFIQLQEALNQVWEVAPRRGQMFRALLRKRLVSFVLVLAVGVLILFSFVLSAGLFALTNLVAAEVPLRVALIAIGNEGLFLLMFSVLIAVIYRVLPDAKLEWRDVGLGAVVTSVLFSIGKWLIGLYLARAGATASFGAASSLVVILLWVYYESAILLVGAEATAVYSTRYRRHRVIPEPGATVAVAASAASTVSSPTG